MTRWLLVVFVLWASPALAQTSTLIYEYPATTPAVVATYTQVTTINGTVVSAVPSCVARGADTVCTQVIPSLGAGNHAIAITATVNGVSQATTQIVNLANGPARPSAPKITITIVIGP